jgi:prophage DNA circulation protein
MDTTQILFTNFQATVDPNQLSLNMTAPQSGQRVKSFTKLTTSLAIATALAFGSATTDFDTANALDQSFSATKPQNVSWINDEVKSWLDQTHGLTATTEMSKLHALIQQVFGPVGVISKIYSDPDESWSKVQIQIDSQLGEDFDRQLALEDKLFAEIWKSTSLKDLSQRLIISQV